MSMSETGGNLSCNAVQQFNQSINMEIYEVGDVELIALFKFGAGCVWHLP